MAINVENIINVLNTPILSKIFKDPILIDQLSKYNSFACVGDSSYNMHVWCAANIGTKGQDWEYLVLGVWVFDNAEDAVWFKMVWS